ncbi:MAG: MBL fold metallo-hydrolase [Rhodothermia bacterium]|nr:MAG: MBL fold metallo-hydrolase [Rhodothermia bacterium]
MNIHFWGVRGSIASPGPSTTKYGGNTMCISVSLDRENTLVLDAGTGLYRLGQEASSDSHTYYFLISHVHWDHINGFPMFRPHMSANASIQILSEMYPGLTELFLSQLDGVHFPITCDEVCATVEANLDVNGTLGNFGLDVSWIRLNHRGACFGYRISKSSKSLVYITDHEIDARQNEHASFEQLASFCSGADILIHDAQYTADEMPTRAGWGHSSTNRVCDLAAEAGVGRLVLCHHDPLRSDDALDRIASDVQLYLEASGAQCASDMAFEGMDIHF